jgi:hypothetical protein
MKKQGLAVVLLFIGVLGISGCNHPKVVPADMVLIHAKIYTVNAKIPWAQAMAVREGKIIAVGSDNAISAYQGPSTKVIDAKEHMVLPGFMDAHVHIMAGAAALEQIALNDAKTIDDFQKMIKDYAADAGLGLSNMRYYQLTPPDPNFDPMTFDFDRDVQRTRNTGIISDADSTFLETFARHGKMIVYNGLSDQGMASSVLADWYDQVIRDNGKPIRESVRLFLVPGMTHCDGGQATDQFDMLEAIMACVEEGRAPDRIKATGKAFPGASRPICPYPLVARYKGGDVNNADSFTCTK